MIIKTLIAADFLKIADRALNSNSASHAELELKTMLPDAAVPNANIIFAEKLLPALQNCGAFSLSQKGEFGSSGADITRNFIYDTPDGLLARNGISYRARGPIGACPTELTVKLRGEDPLLRPEFTLKGISAHFNAASFGGLMRAYPEVEEILNYVGISNWKDLDETARFLTHRIGRYAEFSFSRSGELIPVSDRDSYNWEVNFKLHLCADIIEHYKATPIYDVTFDNDHVVIPDIIKTESEIEAELEAPKGEPLSRLLDMGVTPEMVHQAFMIIEGVVANALGAQSRHESLNIWRDCHEASHSKGERASLLAFEQRGTPIEIGRAPLIGRVAQMLRAA